MRLVDLHVHSTCSADGASTIWEFAHRAAALGLGEVGFCDHVDFDPRDIGYGYFDPHLYEQEIVAAQAAVPGVGLRRGIELTYQASLEVQLGDWLKQHDWDYVVLSVHLVDYADGWAMISEPGTADAYFSAHSPRQAYVPYFEELLRAVHSGMGDVLGHLDLVKRHGTAYYGAFEPDDFEDEIRAVLEAAVQVGVGLEINTSGLRQAPGETYPGLTVLRWYRELGGEILTVGSDAHHADGLGAGIVEALDLARAAGFSAITTYQARRPCWIELEARA